MTEKATPQRKPAPKIEFGPEVKDQRADQLRQLDEQYPDFVHMYQKRAVLDPNDQEAQWDLESKHQEVVMGQNGRPLHHIGDPVVRVPRKMFEAQQLVEANRSREQVEAVVKPDNSTVIRSPRQQKDTPIKKV